MNRRWLADSLAELGLFDEGQVRGEEAIRIAEEADHPYSLSNAYLGMGNFWLCKGDPYKAMSCYRNGLDVCKQWNIR